VDDALTGLQKHLTAGRSTPENACRAGRVPGELFCAASDDGAPKRGPILIDGAPPSGVDP
jgi:hypothetical protein